MRDNLREENSKMRKAIVRWIAWILRVNVNSLVRLPFEEYPLNRWHIIGMNHFRINGTRWLYCSMVNDNDQCITVQGPDPEKVFEELKHKAT